MKTKAFTLIEVLTAIGIISVIAAISFPAFASAKRAAMQRQSMSDLKQIAMSALIYAQDWKKSDFGDMASMGLPEDYPTLFGGSMKQLKPVLRPPIYDPTYPFYYYMPLPEQIDKRQTTWEQASEKYGDRTLLVFDQYILGKDPYSGWWLYQEPNQPNRIMGVDLGGQALKKKAYGYYYDFSNWETNQ